MVGLLPCAPAALSSSACVPGGRLECSAPPCTLAPNYDYIVVGSGAGGGPLAARLARANKRVLLIEAGQDVGGKLEYQVPAMHAHENLQVGRRARLGDYVMGRRAAPAGRAGLLFRQQLE